jgi:hypothetical protein
VSAARALRDARPLLWRAALRIQRSWRHHHYHHYYHYLTRLLARGGAPPSHYLDRFTARREVFLRDSLRRKYFIRHELLPVDKQRLYRSYSGESGGDDNCSGILMGGGKVGRPKSLLLNEMSIFQQRITSSSLILRFLQDLKTGPLRMKMSMHSFFRLILHIIADSF